MHERKIKGNRKTRQNAYLLGSYAMSCLRAACWIERPALGWPATHTRLQQLVPISPDQPGAGSAPGSWAVCPLPLCRPEGRAYWSEPRRDVNSTYIF